MTDDEAIARQLHERWGPLAAASRAQHVPDQEAKEQLLQKILHTQDQPPQQRPRWWAPGKRRLLLSGSAAAVVIAVVLAAITVVPWPSTPSSAFAATPPSLNYQPGPRGPAASVLDPLVTAAQANGRPGSGTVEYIHIESWNLSGRIDGKQVTTAVVPNELRIWRKPDESVVTIQRYETPWFPDDAAERTWKANGSPGSDTSPRRADDPPGGHAWLWQDRPPADPVQLRNWLGRDHNLDDSGGYFTAVVDLLQERVLTGPELAAVLRLLASLPGVYHEGTVKDRAGRPGEALSTDSTSGGLPARHTLIVDRASGRFLAYERTLTATSGDLKVRIPAVTNYVIFHDARFTTSTP